MNYKPIACKCGCTTFGAVFPEPRDAAIIQIVAILLCTECGNIINRKVKFEATGDNSGGRLGKLGLN